MKVQPLSFGVVLGREDFKVILHDSGYFQLMEHAIFPKVKPDDYVFFVPKKNDKSDFVVLLNEFDYFENIRCNERDDYDYALYNDWGLCIPKEILVKSKRFIVNNGFGYQYVYYQNKETTYAGGFFPDQEGKIINAFFKNKLYLKDTFDINQKLCAIDQYLNELDIDGIIDSFTIENEETFICRPGKDDYYYVDKVYKEIDEPFINRLFPHHSEKIYKDSGFCEAHSMSINPPKRPYIEEENELKRSAKEKYNKDEHRRFLTERIIWDYKSDVIERCENEHYKNMIFGRALKRFINVDRWKIYEGDYEEYLIQLCEEYNFLIESSKNNYKYFFGKK